jgi:hypothetical protein
MTQDEDRQLAATEQQLVREFGPVLGEERVRHDVQDVLREFETVAVRAYLPVLVLRRARQRLRGAAPV